MLTQKIEKAYIFPTFSVLQVEQHKRTGIIPAAVALCPSPNEIFKLEFRNTVKNRERNSTDWASWHEPILLWVQK